MGMIPSLALRACIGNDPVAYAQGLYGVHGVHPIQAPGVSRGIALRSRTTGYSPAVVDGAGLVPCCWAAMRSPTAET